MAAITLSPTANIDANSNMYAVYVTSGAVVMEDIVAGQPCEIRTVNGKDGIYKLAALPLAGFAPKALKAGTVLGHSVTLYGIGARFRISDTALAASTYYVGTGGTINDAATAQDARGALIRISPYDVLCVAMGKLA